MSDINKTKPLREVGKLSTSSKTKLVNQCEKSLNTFRNDVCVNINCISKILDRLLTGYCRFMVDLNYFRLAIDKTKEYRVEINPHQFHRIVDLKCFLKELDAKVIENMLTVTELLMFLGNENQVIVVNKPLDNLHNMLSPIHKSSRKSFPEHNEQTSFTSSTPGYSRASKLYLKTFSILPQAKESLLNINEDGIPAFDSKYLLTPSNISLRGSFDNLDIIPFSDDEYEKISVIDNTDDGLNLSESLQNFPINDEAPFTNEFESKASACKHLDYREFCNRQNYWRINRFNGFLFNYNSKSQIPESERKAELFTTDFYKDKGMYRIDRLSLDIDNVDDLKLHYRDREEIKNKISILMIEDDWNKKFNSALALSILKVYQNSSIDLREVLRYMEQLLGPHFPLFSPFNMITSKSSFKVDDQYNNSACTLHSFIKTNSASNSEQNTNNNADSKDEESNELIPNNIGTKNDENSLCLDSELQLGFKDILPESIKDEQNLGINGSLFTTIPQYTIYRDGTVNTDECSLSDQSHSDSCDNISTYAEISSEKPSNTSNQGVISDIELIVKLSELHLRAEFQSEENNKSIMIYDKDRIIDNYKIIDSHVMGMLNGRLFHSVNKRSTKNDVVCHNSGLPILLPINTNCVKKNNSQDRDSANLCDTVDEIKEEIRTDVFNSILAESLVDSGNDYAVEKPINSTSLESCFSDSPVTCFGRISLSIKLTQKLLNITHYQLKFISALFNRNIFSIKSTITRNKSLSVSVLHQRLDITMKILYNLKFALQNSHHFSQYRQSFSDIMELIDRCENLIQFSCDFEIWLKENGCEIDKIDCYNFENELPDDLLIKMDPNEFEVAVGTSVERLKTTITSLSQYPCYNYFMQSSQLETDSQLKNGYTLNQNIGSTLDRTDLLQKLCKLRRATAICALNIVDLHVLLTKMENDKESETKVNDLLLFWREVDVECHRLLRCTSLVHYIMTNIQRCYADLVSMIVVMNSIVRTVELTPEESISMNTDIESLTNFKRRILNWLEEFELCLSVLYKKRMTNKRFKYYDEIHNYLEENINTISELSGKIKNGCHKAIDLVFEVVTYCASLSNCNVTETGKFLITKDANKDDFGTFITESSCNEINQNLFYALIDLEELTMRMSKSISKQASKINLDLIQDLCLQGRNIAHVVSDEKNSCLFKLQSRSDFSSLTEAKPSNHMRESLLENAVINISNKICQIAICAATNALLLFGDGCKTDLYSCKSAEKQMNGWIKVVEEPTILNELSGELEEDIRTVVTSFFICNSSMQLDDKQTIFQDMCHEISDRTVQHVFDYASVNRKNVDEMFLIDTTTNIKNHLFQQLGFLVAIDATPEELPKGDFNCFKNSLCTSASVSQSYQKHFLHVTKDLQDIPLFDTIDSFEDNRNGIQKYMIKPQNWINEASISVLEEHSVDQDIREFRSQEIASNQYSIKMKPERIWKKSVSKECKLYQSESMKMQLSKFKSTSNKILQLIARFNGDTGKPFSNNKSSSILFSSERICLNMFNKSSKVIIESVVNDIFNQSKLNYASLNNQVLNKNESYCSESKINGNGTNIKSKLKTHSIGDFHVPNLSLEMISINNRKTNHDQIYPNVVGNSHIVSQVFTESRRPFSSTEIVYDQLANQNLNLIQPKMNLTDVVSENHEPSNSLQRIRYDMNLINSCGNNSATSKYHPVSINESSFKQADILVDFSALDTTNHNIHIPISYEEDSFKFGVGDNLVNDKFSKELKNVFKLDNILVTENRFPFTELKDNSLSNINLINFVREPEKPNINSLTYHKQNKSNKTYKYQQVNINIPGRKCQNKKDQNYLEPKTRQPRVVDSGKCKVPHKRSYYITAWFSFAVLVVLSGLLAHTVRMPQIYDCVKFSHSFFLKLTSNGLPI